MVFSLGTKVLARYDSPINGKIEVHKTIAWGTYVQVGGLTQSGGVVYDVWKTTLKKVKSKNSKVKSCLILGLAGGSAARLVRQYWTEAEIIGVEIDPIMINIGQVFLGLNEVGVEAIEADAEDYLKDAAKTKKEFDLILIDMYVGTEVPKKFENSKFIRSVKRVLSESGTAVFNRLYYGEKKQMAKEFMKLLSQEFELVEKVHPQANVMYVCSNGYNR